MTTCDSCGQTICTVPGCSASETALKRVLQRSAGRWAQTMGARVVVHTTQPVDLLNEWVVEVDGVRRARYVGPNATYHAAREANRWRRVLTEGEEQ